MEATGIGIDAAALAQFPRNSGRNWSGWNANATNWRDTSSISTRRFNCVKFLFDELKLSAKGLKKTKSGFSTDADTLEKLADGPSAAAEADRVPGPGQTQIDL